MSRLFDRHSEQQHAKSLGDFMPGGRMFEAKQHPDTNFYKLLLGFAGELFRTEDLLRAFDCNYYIEDTNAFIEEWESALGIPDQCFRGTGTIEQRRRDVLVKLAASGVQTADDFEALAALFGIPVSVVPAGDVGKFPLTFPIFFPLENTPTTVTKFTICVFYQFAEPTVFPLNYPIPFGQSEINFLECIFNRLKPANTVIHFEGIQDLAGAFNISFSDAFNK